MVTEDNTHVLAEPYGSQDWGSSKINRTEAAGGDRADVRAQKGQGRQWCEPGRECWQQKDRRLHTGATSPHRLKQDSCQSGTLRAGRSLSRMQVSERIPKNRSSSSLALISGKAELEMCSSTRD